MGHHEKCHFIPVAIGSHWGLKNRARTFSSNSRFNNLALNTTQLNLLLLLNFYKSELISPFPGGCQGKDYQVSLLEFLIQYRSGVASKNFHF